MKPIANPKSDGDKALTKASIKRTSLSGAIAWFKQKNSVWLRSFPWMNFIHKYRKFHTFCQINGEVFLLKKTEVFRQFDGLALGEEADFEALNCQPSTKFDTR